MVDTKLFNMEATELNLLKRNKNDIGNEYIILNDVEYLYNISDDDGEDNDDLSKLLKELGLFEDLYEFFKGIYFILAFNNLIINTLNYLIIRKRNNHRSS